MELLELSNLVGTTVIVDRGADRGNQKTAKNSPWRHVWINRM